jgi:hypothetical protein
VTFDETAPCPRGVFECAGDKEIEKSIFVDEGLQGVDGDKDKPLLDGDTRRDLAACLAWKQVWLGFSSLA